MRINIVFLLLFITSSLFAQKVGDWRLHFRYENSNDLARTEEKVYSATDKSLLVYDKREGSLRLMDKSNSLSDIGIAGIEYSEESDVVVVAYNSSNVDLIKGNTIINVPDIKNKITSGSKAIHEIYVDSNVAYLSSDLGIVVLDLDNEEVDNTYVIGATGDPVSVYDCTIFQDTIFALTLEGLKKAPLDSDNLLDFENWEHNVPVPFVGVFDFIESYDDTLYAAKDSILYQYMDGDWDIIFSQASAQIQSLTASDNITFTIYQLDINNQFESSVSYELEGATFDTIDMENTLRPTIVLKDGTTYFVADKGSGLLKFYQGNREWLLPSGMPFGNTAYRMSSAGDKVFVSGGLYDGGLNAQFNINGAYYFQDNQWRNINIYSTNGLVDVYDMSSVVYNPIDNNLYIGSAKGLVRYDFTSAEIYDFSNSILDTISQGYANDRTLIMGVDIDAQGNIWMVNSQAPDPLAVMTREGVWHKFNINGNIKKYNKLFIDEDGRKWITLAGEGIFVYDEGDIIGSTSDDNVIQLGSSSLHNKNVNTIVQDKEGEIWVGTDEGIAVFDCPSQVMDFSSGCAVSRRIKSTLDEYTEYLFETDIVKAIAVDGANRKWIGTESGVWLMNETGEEELLNFNTENSPLPSNIVTDIAINEETGEVFIGTELGIVSYTGDATEPAETHDNVVVYPNPVRPEYQGLVSITGLVEDAFVKIADIYGNVIDEGFALGGKYLWNGKDYNGDKAKTGVYIIYSSNTDGSEKIAAKVSFVN